MKKRFVQFIDYLATGWNVILMILIWLFYAVFAMALSGSSSENNIGPIDITFAPSPTIICRMIEAYGEDIRHDYFYGEMTWDAVYPLIYGLMLLLTMSYGMRRAAFNFPHKENLLFLPLVVMGTDYCENIGIISLLWMYPSCSVEVAALVSIFVTIKWVTTIICFLLLIGFLFFALFRKIRHTK